MIVEYNNSFKPKIVLYSVIITKNLDGLFGRASFGIRRGLGYLIETLEDWGVNEMNIDKRGSLWVYSFYKKFRDGNETGQVHLRIRDNYDPRKGLPLTTIFSCGEDAEDVNLYNLDLIKKLDISLEKDICPEEREEMERELEEFLVPKFPEDWDE